MTNKTLVLNDILYEYILSVSLREPEVLQRLRAETLQTDRSEMLSAPEQGQFMALLVELLGAKKCLEIGVFTGYSTLWMALALPADGSILACDVSERWTDTGRRYWEQAGVADKIILQLAPALETLDRLLADGSSGQFDLAFIDADKENYLAYYERTLQLLRQGGLMIIDNVLWSGDVVNALTRDRETRAIQALNLHIHADQRVHMSLIPVADGITLVRKL